MRAAFLLILLALMIAASSVAASAAIDGGAARTFAHDTRGNVTSNGPTGFVYDYANQPTAVTGTGAADYAYDGNLKRVKEVRAGKTVYQLFSRVTGGLVYRDEVTDGETTDYVSVGGAALRLKKTTTLTPEYVHFDHQGSAVAATDASGAVLWRERYSPWGTRLLKPLGNKGDTGFTGHLMDNTTELIYMQARYYDSQIGRFYSTDPIGYQDQLNLYAYVYNDPVNNTDPTGECGPLSHICAGAIIGAAGGAISYAIETAGKGEFTGGGLLANTLKGAAIGATVASGAGLVTVAAVGGTANAVDDAATAISSNQGVSDGIADYTEGPGGAAGAVAKSFLAGAAEAVIGGKAAQTIGKAVTGGLEKAAASTATSATGAARGAIAGTAEPIGDIAGEVAVATTQRATEIFQPRDDDIDP